MDKKQQFAEIAATSLSDNTVGGMAGKTTVAGAATLVYGGYTINEIAIFIGAVVAVGGFVVQIIAQYHAAKSREKEDARKDELHAHRMALIRMTQKEMDNDSVAARALDACTTQFNDSDVAPLTPNK